MEQKTTNQVRVTRYSKMWLKEGIMFGEFLPGTVLNITAAKTCVKDRLKFFSGKSYPVCIDLSNLKYADKKARDFLANDENSITGIPAGALITKNHLSKLLAGVFITFSKPKAPLKIFTNKRDAVRFLKKYR